MVRKRGVGGPSKGDGDARCHKRKQWWEEVREDHTLEKKSVGGGRTAEMEKSLKGNLVAGARERNKNKEDSMGRRYWEVR